MNDLHAQLDNFAKIKYIVDEERQHSEVLLVNAGDMFSGNPVVDNYPQQGYPLIDIMNQCGFDVSVLGNHEFDYGVEILGERMLQSDYNWVCANLDPAEGLIHKPYTTIVLDDLRVSFLGLVETEGKPDDIIPLTHPWKVKDLVFQEPFNVVAQYADLKETEDADLLIALTHLGHHVDYELAESYPYFDLVIGGHSHSTIDTEIYGTPVFQAGSYLQAMGKIELDIVNGLVIKSEYEVIDLNSYPNTDETIVQSIQDYKNSMAHLDDVIGYSETYISKYEGLGCFYTDALRFQLNVDLSFQNTGGIRNVLNEGDITKREIYAISPFNNGTIVYSMSVSEIKTFLRNSGAGFFYSGINIEQQGNQIIIKDEYGVVLEDGESLSIGINDYIPAVYDMYFPPLSSGIVQPHTDAETIISYLESIPNSINYEGCNRYFRYQE